MILLQLELGRVLDRDDALVAGDEGGQGVEGRRLTGTGSARDEDVELPLDAGGQEVRRLRRDGAEVDQVVHRVRVARELPDGEDRPPQRERRDDRVDAAAVRQAGVHHRRGLVDPAADLGDDLVDDAEEVRVVDERRLRQLDLARTLDVDPVGPVDHDLADVVLPEQRLEWPVAQDVVGDLADDLPALVPGQRGLVERELLRDDPQDAIG